MTKVIPLDLTFNSYNFSFFILRSSTLLFSHIECLKALKTSTNFCLVQSWVSILIAVYGGALAAFSRKFFRIIESAQNPIDD
jgi:hypothetical protein